MALQMQTRHVGKVTVVRCSGRIVAGEDSESLHEHISRLLPSDRHFLLDLAEVSFVDSTGLGMLVRLLANVRSARGDLKLCNACKEVVHTLNITNLNKLLDTHASEVEAITAFYQHSLSIESALRCGKTVVCVEQSADVLAYVRELLRQAGYDPLTTANVPDARILIKAARPDLVILGPSVRIKPGEKHEALRHVLHGIPVIELGSGFSTIDAGDAAQQVLEQVKARIAGAGN